MSTGANINKHKIAIFLNDMNHAGGIQRVAANLACDLRPWYETIILSAEPLINPVFYNSNIELKSLNTPLQFLSYPKRISALFKVGLQLKKFIQTENIDTVLAIWYHLATVAAFVLPKKVKTIGCEHINYSIATPLWQYIRKISYPHLNSVVSLTQTDLPYFSHISNSVHWIPNYVPIISHPFNTNREKIILTVGHLVLRKGIDRLIWALKQPLHDHPDWKWVLIGGGEQAQSEPDLLDHIATLINLFNLNNQIEFYPATEKINEWYQRAAIYVMGSREEGLPMVLLEAKAHGLPIVSFDCPTGPKEIIQHEIDGLLINNNTNDFALAVSSLIENPSLRHSMGIAAIEDVQIRFSKDKIIKQWIQLIESLHTS